MKQKVKNNNGFGILEIIISIFIISMAFIALLSLTGQNIQAQNTNENSLVASQLAQEGLELVRNQRDDAWFDHEDYDKYIYKAGDLTFTIDYTANAADYSAETINDEAARLFIDASGNYAHDNSGTATPFYRLITISTDDESKYLEVECEVKWNERGKDNEYTVKTLLYAWR